MKFARSSAAALLFVAIANCIPVATNTDSQASITSSTFPTTITMSDGSSMQANCQEVQIFDPTTGGLIETTKCSPGNSDNIDNDNASPSSTSTTTSATSTSTTTSASSSASTTTTDAGAIIIATGSTDASSTIILGAAPTQSIDVNSSNSDGSGNNNTTTASGSVLSNTGIGTKIIGNGTISVSDINPSSSDDLSDAGREKGKRNVVTSSNVKMTPDGPVSENCQIQLTPQGNGLYTEVQTCEVSIEPNNADSSPMVPSSTPGGVPPPSATPSPVSPSSSPLSPPASSVSAPTSPVPVSSLSPSSDPASPTPESSSPAGSDNNGNGAIVISTGWTSLSLPTASALGSLSSTSNGTAAADSAAAFSVPGKHLSVLPVGLAIFAGVSVIALVVVGVVTYERTKYRKNFRKRQLAEQLKARADQMSERPLV